MANKGQRRSRKAHSSQQRPTQAHEDEKGPKRRVWHRLGHRYFNVQFIYYFLTTTQAHQGPQQPMKANEGQHRSTNISMRPSSRPSKLLLFLKPSSLGNQYLDKFQSTLPEVEEHRLSILLVALGATGVSNVQCNLSIPDLLWQLYVGLYEFNSGFYKELPFSGNIFIRAYTAHIASLKKLQSQKLTQFYEVMSELYKLVMFVSPSPFSHYIMLMSFQVCSLQCLGISRSNPQVFKLLTVPIPMGTLTCQPMGLPVQFLAKMVKN
jgi:hypothetical protein